MISLLHTIHKILVIWVFFVKITGDLKNSLVQNAYTNDNLWNVCRIVSIVPSLPLLAAVLSCHTTYLFALGVPCQHKTSRQFYQYSTLFLPTAILSNPKHFKVSFQTASLKVPLNTLSKSAIKAAAWHHLSWKYYPF